ncbi:virulence factor SrfB, partial [Erwinia amylovora]|uniref:virulence factor SrfB n=1 Tax=Erwinia amylovora TaxID=552 RepID=UPI0020BFEF3A
QLDNDRWPASPLYTLTIVDSQLARSVAGYNVLRIKLAVSRPFGEFGPERFAIAEASLDDGSLVPIEHLCLRLNTLAGSGSGIAHYWIDSG